MGSPAVARRVAQRDLGWTLESRGRVGEELARVFTAGRSQDVSRRPVVLNAPAFQDNKMIGAVGRYAKIVGDEHNGSAAFGAQLVNEIENALLYGDIESAGRLIGDDQRRSHCDRNRDRHTLAHATRQLVRVLARAQRRLRETDPGEKINDTQVDLLPAALFVDL